MALRRSGSGKPDTSSLHRIGSCCQDEDRAITAIDEWRRGSPGSVKVAHFLNATDSRMAFGGDPGATFPLATGPGAVTPPRGIARERTSLAVPRHKDQPPLGGQSGVVQRANSSTHYRA
jgi:hypothetical protein